MDSVDNFMEEKLPNLKQADSLHNGDFNQQSHGFKVLIKTNKKQKSKKGYDSTSQIPLSINKNADSNSINEQLENAFRECEKIDQMILEEKQKQQNERRKRMKVFDSELRLKLRQKYININNSELNISNTSSYNRQDNAPTINVTNLGKLKLEMIKSRNSDIDMIKHTATNVNKNKDELNVDYINYSQTMPYISNEDSSKLRRYYQNDLLARNQLK